MLRIFTDFHPFGQSSLSEAVRIRETRVYPCPDFSCEQLPHIHTHTPSPIRPNTSASKAMRT